jgi:hypothetical protein
VGLAEVSACGCVVLRSPWRSLLFFFSVRSSHKMMGKVALLGLAVACGVGGAAAQVSTANVCPFSLLVRRGVGAEDARLDGAGRGSSAAQRNVTARPCVRAHQECSADLGINNIVGVDDLPFLLSQVGRSECSVLEGAQKSVVVQVACARDRAIATARAQCQPDSHFTAGYSQGVSDLSATQLEVSTAGPTCRSSIMTAMEQIAATVAGVGAANSNSNSGVSTVFIDQDQPIFDNALRPVEKATPNEMMNTHLANTSATVLSTDHCSLVLVMVIVLWACVLGGFFASQTKWMPQVRRAMQFRRRPALDCLVLPCTTSLGRMLPFIWIALVLPRKTLAQQGCGNPVAWNYDPNASVTNESLCFVPPCATTQECGPHSNCVPDFLTLPITPENMGRMRYVLMTHDENNDMYLSARERFTACGALSSECNDLDDACQSLYGVNPPQESPCTFCNSCDVADTYSFRRIVF